MRVGAKRNVVRDLMALAQKATDIAKTVDTASMPELKNVGIGYEADGKVVVEIDHGSYRFVVPDEHEKLLEIVDRLVWAIVETTKHDDRNYILGELRNIIERHTKASFR